MSPARKIESYGGAKKAALLLLSMGKAHAAQVLRHFTAEELRLIPRFGPDVERISGVEIEGLVEEFGREFADGMKFLGTSQEVEDLISGVLTPEQIAQMKSEPVAEAREPVWGRLSTLNEQVLASYVALEHPQIATVILSRMPSELAAKVLGLLNAGLRRDVMGRMLSLAGLHDEAVVILERALGEDLLAGPVRGQQSETRSRVADIINRLDEEQVADALSNLAQTRPEDADALRGMLFSFTDIAKLSKAARTLLFDKVPTDRLVFALTSADPGLQELALSSLTARTRRMVEAELKGGQNPSPRDIRSAQRGIADLALAMAGRGEIDLNSSDAESVSQVA
ncbi:flagellar motor switch protein FliG [Nordella sp. HKS 07]|uniref:FliG C-terminal domain-containing protein n=1 Tax=Nordella sp. HKS 07 TaxID=2712222 RepID=UPI0013E177C6|nr:FliG C-terminal domain-containing protein [Nordella sp. HKS 07]QIG49880.1 flagellar motor switch protein FliG [Nordella sp. HKS 07]